MTEAVLDASAVLAVINEEPGAERVEAVLPGAAISVYNVAEVVAKLLDNGMPAEIAEAVIEGLQLDIVDGDLAQAFRNGRLRPVTKSAGLSLGDRACLALAQELGLPAITADKVWQTIAKPAGVQIVLIRQGLRCFRTGCRSRPGMTGVNRRVIWTPIGTASH